MCLSHRCLGCNKIVELRRARRDGCGNANALYNVCNSRDIRSCPACRPDTWRDAVNPYWFRVRANEPVSTWTNWNISYGTEAYARWSQREDLRPAVEVQQELRCTCDGCRY